jgi:hypothetical protein
MEHVMTETGKAGQGKNNQAWERAKKAGQAGYEKEP